MLPSNLFQKLMNAEILRKTQEYCSSSENKKIIQDRKSNIAEKLKSHRHIIVLKDESRKKSIFTVDARNGRVIEGHTKDATGAYTITVSHNIFEKLVKNYSFIRMTAEGRVVFDFETRQWKIIKITGKLFLSQQQPLQLI
jgi:protease II